MIGSDGRFRIVHRGGNLAIHVFSESPVAPLRKQLEQEVETSLGGRVDGGLEHALVFTVPLSAGFPAVDRFFDELVRSRAGMVWSYNNVYDPASGEPLNWWVAGA